MYNKGVTVDWDRNQMGFDLVIDLIQNVESRDFS